MFVAKLVRWLNSYFLWLRQEPTEREAAQIQERLRKLLNQFPEASALPSKESEIAPTRKIALNHAENGGGAVVRLRESHRGITPPEVEHRVFPLVVLIGAVLIVAALLFMFWQRFPVERPVQHSPVLQSK